MMMTPNHYVFVIFITQRTRLLLPNKRKVSVEVRQHKNPIGGIDVSLIKFYSIEDLVKHCVRLQKNICLVGEDHYVEIQ